MTAPEVLAPAGDRERLGAALLYGADAVYLGGETFGMRAGAPNFDRASLVEAVRLAHARGVRVYLTVNTLPRNPEMERLPSFLAEAERAGVDALIVADLGVFRVARRCVPALPVHMSTQTGIVNYETACALYEMGARRVVLARELSLEEIACIRRNTPEDLELEAFVHGAMCVSFSGRCLLSAYLADRDPNRGECAQPCRWKYFVTEENRPDAPFTAEETPEGTYFFNARDLCMIDHLEALRDAGVSSLKIEGRAKSAYYVAAITNAYRMAQAWYTAHPGEALPAWIRDEVFKVSHRRYCTGFYLGGQPGEYYASSGYITECEVAGVVERCENGMVYATQRNRFFAGDSLEVLSPGKKPVALCPRDIYDGNGARIEAVNHAMMAFSFPCEEVFLPGSFIRRPLPSSEPREIT